MPRSKEFLLEQIARAKRFARAMNTDADRERFEKMAADLQSELEGAEERRVNRPSPERIGRGDPNEWSCRSAVRDCKLG